MPQPPPLSRGFVSLSHRNHHHVDSPLNFGFEASAAYSAR